MAKTYLIYLAGGIPLILVVIGFCIFYAIYFWFMDSVPWDQYALKKDKVLNKLTTEEVFRGGRHFLGVSGAFVFFPAVPQSVDWIGSCTADYTNYDFCQVKGKDSTGQDVYVDLSFQYIIEKEQVLSIFKRFGSTDYKTLVQRDASSAIRAGMQNYSNLDFIQKRDEIRNTFRTLLNDVYQSNNITLMAFQLENIDLNDEFESKLEEELLLKQKVIKELLNQEYETIVSDTDVQLEEIYQEIETIELTTQGFIGVIDYQIEANMTVYKLNIQQEVFNNTIHSLGFKKSTDFLRYFYNDKLMKLKDKDFFIVTDDQTVIIDPR